MMKKPYRYIRNWENQEKHIFNGVGKYDIPFIKPEKYHSVEWIGFNQAKATQLRKEKGIHHFVDDYQFIREWRQPDRYVNLFKQYDFVMSPDFSLYANFPKALQIYNHFRKHWIGAYFQSKGIHVIPTICWSTPDSFSWCFDGEPHHSTVAVSSIGCNHFINQFMYGYREMMKKLSPTTIIFYGDVPKECYGNIVHIQKFTSKFKEATMNGW